MKETLSWMVMGLVLSIGAAGCDEEESREEPAEEAVEDEAPVEQAATPRPDSAAPQAAEVAGTHEATAATAAPEAAEAADAPEAAEATSAEPATASGR